MTQATDTDIRDIKTAIEANTKAIGELKDSVASLREETRVGLTRIDGDIRELRSEIGSLDAKFDERTKLGFWGFILRGVVLTAIVAVGHCGVKR
jgi:predicted RNase H-like nuclease (RuvC/YqgF family)